jgi:hypothetical protein
MGMISIEGTLKTPSVILDTANGFIEIKGRSIPENSVAFYKPLNESLIQYAAKPKPITNVNIKLEYFNTSSSKCILDLFKNLENIHKDSSQVNINWFYEEDDEDMLETGEFYREIINVPFKMVVITS